MVNPEQNFVSFKNEAAQYFFKINYIPQLSPGIHNVQRRDGQGENGSESTVVRRQAKER